MIYCLQTFSHILKKRNLPLFSNADYMGPNFVRHIQVVLFTFTAQTKMILIIFHF